jgi:hypothetical protein
LNRQQLRKLGVNRKKEANVSDRRQSTATGEDMLDQVFHVMEAVACSSVPPNVINSERDALDIICERTEEIICSDYKCDNSIFAIDTTNMDQYSPVLVGALSACRNDTAHIANRLNGHLLDVACHRDEPATCHGNNNEQEGIKRLELCSERDMLDELCPERDMLDVVCEGMELELCGIDHLDEARDDVPVLPRRTPMSGGRSSTNASISSPAFQCQKVSRYGRHHQEDDAPSDDDDAKFPISQLFRQHHHDSSAPLSYAMSGSKTSKNNANELPSRAAAEVERIVPPLMRDTMVEELGLGNTPLYWVPSGSTLCDAEQDLSLF